MAIERIDVYLDDATEPIRRLEGLPFALDLDTASLSDGEHTLRVLTVHSDQKRSERRIGFTVRNGSDLGLEGLEDGATVSGPLKLRFQPEATTLAARSNIPAWIYPVASLVVLGGIWAFFAFTSGGASGATVDAALLKQGTSLFAQNCSSCHGAQGKGTPGYAPPLAGNPNLGDANHVIDTVVKGLKTGVEVAGTKYTSPMPSFEKLSDDEIAAITTSVRNSWGNQFGGISASEVKARR